MGLNISISKPFTLIFSTAYLMNRIQTDEEIRRVRLKERGYIFPTYFPVFEMHTVQSTLGWLTKLWRCFKVILKWIWILFTNPYLFVMTDDVDSVKMAKKKKKLKLHLFLSKFIWPRAFINSSLRFARHMWSGPASDQMKIIL